MKQHELAANPRPVMAIPHGAITEQSTAGGERQTDAAMVTGAVFLAYYSMSVFLILLIYFI